MLIYLAPILVFTPGYRIGKRRHDNVLEDIKLLAENESVYIPLGATHCLENPGKIPLDLIEVRSGSYLDEDDVVRFADRYGRA